MTEIAPRAMICNLYARLALWLTQLVQGRCRDLATARKAGVPSGAAHIAACDVSATRIASSFELVKLDPLYCDDDYPREGCVIKVLVRNEGFNVDVYAPGHDRHPIEMWAPCPTRESLELLVGCLATGEKVPKGYRSMGRAADDPAEV